MNRWLKISVSDYLCDTKFSLMSNQKNFQKPYLEHLAFWVFMLLFIFDYHFVDGNWWIGIRNALLEISTYAIIVYLNLKILIPYFLQRKKITLYIICIVCSILLYVFVVKLSGLETIFYSFSGSRNVFSMILNTSLFLMISTLYWYFKQWSIERENKLKMKTEKLEFELDFLRSQISPHFIFNSLNNVYALALQKHDNTAPMIAKISNIMRYIIYDTKEGKVSLDKELNILQTYIDLHMYRQPMSQNIDFYKEGNLSPWSITPSLLIDFIENTFKHSNFHQDKDAWIKISAEVSEDGTFDFTTENNISKEISPKGGLGLSNVQRQMELRYPNIHKIHTQAVDNIYTMTLQIKLSRV